MELMLTVFFSLCLLLLADARFSKDYRCGATRGCFSDCRSFDGCTYIIMWAQTSTGVDFTLKAELRSASPTYISFGLSSDEKMGEDSVSECVMNSGTFNVYNSYNPDDDNEMTTNPALGLSSITGAYTDGILECSFKRANTTTDPQIFSLITDWYLFWAIGDYDTEDAEKDEHDDWGISERIVDLQSYDDVGERKNRKMKAHACLTIIAWIGLCSIGVVLARYYKPMWVSKKIFGAAIWFQIHRAILIAAVALNFIAVIVIVSGSGNLEIYGSSIQRAHPVLGIIVTVVSILNCVGGFLRPGPKHKFRPIFNWSHLALGLISYILAVFTIGIGVTIDDASVPFEVLYVIITFVVYQLLFELMLELIDRKGKQKTAAYNTDTQMNTVSGSKVKIDVDTNGSTSPSPMVVEHDLKPQKPRQEPETHCSGLKNMLLGIHIGIILAFTLTILIVVAIF